MSASVIMYDLIVTRWQPDSRGRLERSALELYSERGFENTTVAEIAERAGLTERTFFRYFADKPEVLFSGGEHLEEIFSTAVRSAPEGLSPFDAAQAGLDAVAELLEQRRDFAVLRSSIIATNQELRERELIKLQSLAAALAQALRSRGAKEPSATLTGEIAIAVFKIAFERWVEPTTEEALNKIVREIFQEMRVLSNQG